MMFNYKEFVNSAAKWGLIIGVLMSISRVVESKIMVSGGLSEFVFLTFEWVGAMVVFVLLMYRANKQRSVTKSDGYSFRDTLNYTVLISIFASFIVAVSSHIYIVNYVGGYDVFAESSMNSIMSILAQTDTDMQGSAALLEQSANAAKEMAQAPPTIFSYVLSSAANYIVAGFVTTLMIFAFVRRRFSDATGNKSEGNNERA
ncbi:MAG: DUF4199 domain-containing protein [Rikenellaceae bacterium]